MPDDDDGVESSLADLGQLSFSDLAEDRENLDGYRLAMLAQVEKPRTNLGSGPPGRAD